MWSAFRVKATDDALPSACNRPVSERTLTQRSMLGNSKSVNGFNLEEVVPLSACVRLTASKISHAGSPNKPLQPAEALMRRITFNCLAARCLSVRPKTKLSGISSLA